MFYIIETKDQLEQLDKELKDESNVLYVKLIPYSYEVHPKLSNLSCVYIRSLRSHKGYLILMKHSEALNRLNKKDVFELISKYTLLLDEVKNWHYFFSDANVIDIDLLKQYSQSTLKTEYDFDTCSDFFKEQYPLDYNFYVPISKHYGYSEAYYNSIKEWIEGLDVNEISNRKDFEFYNNTVTKQLYEIEKNGLSIDEENFDDCFKIKKENSIKDKRIYSSFNTHTLTGRPSNSFNGVNFLSLNKDSGERRSFDADDNLLIEIDYNSYHPRLIAELMHFNIYGENFYGDLREEFEVETVEEAKILTFGQLYGGVKDQYLHIPYFNALNEYTQNLWSAFQADALLTYISERSINTTRWYNEDMNPAKLLNYYVQNFETERNIKIIKKLNTYLKGTDSKLILYSYDSFLFEVTHSDGSDCIEKLEEIISSPEYPVSIKYGRSLHKMKKI